MVDGVVVGLTLESGWCCLLSLYGEIFRTLMVEASDRSCVSTALDV